MLGTPLVVVLSNHDIHYKLQIMLQREKVYEWVDVCAFVGLLFSFAYKIWDYTVLLIIRNLFFTGSLLMTVLSCYLSWRDTHSLRQVFRQNRLWLVTLMIFPIVVYVLVSILRCCRA